MISVVIAEQYPVVRAGLRTLLSAATDIQIVAEVDSENEAKQLLANLQPQVLLLNSKLTGLFPFEIEKWTHTDFTRIATLVLTTQKQDIYLTNLIEAGVAGMLNLEISSENLAEAIRRVARGETLFDAQQLEQAQNWRKTVGQKWELLSSRQKQVLQLIAQGANRKEVAVQLKIGRSAVNYHIGNLLENLKFRSLLEAVCWLYKYFPNE